jgi:hypothetical protein
MKNFLNLKTEFSLSDLFTLLLAALGLGVAIPLLILMNGVETKAKERPPIPIVICESGSFEFENGTEEDKNDKYFVNAAKCNSTDANGPEVIVKVID